jgi:hypothetical protein
MNEIQDKVESASIVNKALWTSRRQLFNGRLVHKTFDGYQIINFSIVHR